MIKCLRDPLHLESWSPYVIFVFSGVVPGALIILGFEWPYLVKLSWEIRSMRDAVLVVSTLQASACSQPPAVIWDRCWLPFYAWNS